jgi:DNA-binding NarL/FixJ family response regulator
MKREEPSAAQAPSRIVVADDHPLFRSAISYTLEAQPDLEVVAEAADGREALELCRCLRPELVLMDLGMPIMDGVAATREVDVLRMVVLGRTNQQIARNLSISVSTFKRHVRHIREKLEACDRVQAAVRAIEFGLLDERSGG